MSWRYPAFALATAALLHAGPAAASPRLSAGNGAPFRCAALAFDPSFARALDAERPARHVVRSIAVDVDRDGDLDVVASTMEEPVVVWLQDDAGRFTRERPFATPILTSAAVFSTPFGGAIASAPTSSTNQTAAERPSSGTTLAGSSLRVRPQTSFGAPARVAATWALRGPPAVGLA